MRDRSLDLAKGLAILFVYLGHSILYHPIEMVHMYSWCHTLERFIVSFNMPMFFIISGYLFSRTNKSTLDLYKGKTMRIMVPYLFTMAILVGVKLILPSSMSYNSAAGSGVKTMVINAFFYGGDRWFAYVLYIIFLLLIPVRYYLKNKWIDIALIVSLIGIHFMDFLPSIFELNRVGRYMVFFIAGYALNDFYPVIKDWSKRNWWMVYSVFFVANLFFIESLCKVLFVFRFVLPFIGTLAVMTMAFQLEKTIDRSKVVQYIEYVGKYSLQFYLFTFCYPIIRMIIVSVLHVNNPFLILGLVFIQQLVTTTIIVEITRRINWLKIPCGY